MLPWQPLEYIFCLTNKCIMYVPGKIDVRAYQNWKFEAFVLHEVFKWSDQILWPGNICYVILQYISISRTHFTSRLFFKLELKERKPLREPLLKSLANEDFVPLVHYVNSVKPQATHCRAFIHYASEMNAALRFSNRGPYHSSILEKGAASCSLYSGPNLQGCVEFITGLCIAKS